MLRGIIGTEAGLNIKFNFMSEFYKQYFCPFNDIYSLIVEDDGKVSYAYLLKERDVISDVWLYNQQKNPNKTDWSNRDDMPFLNPQEYILEDAIMCLPIKEDSDVDLEWKCNDEAIEVKVYVRKELIAILRPYLFPAFSLLVCKDSPLAKKWVVS